MSNAASAPFLLPLKPIDDEPGTWWRGELSSARSRLRDAQVNVAFSFALIGLVSVTLVLLVVNGARAAAGSSWFAVAAFAAAGAAAFLLHLCSRAFRRDIRESKEQTVPERLCRLAEDEENLAWMHGTLSMRIVRWNGANDRAHAGTPGSLLAQRSGIERQTAEYMRQFRRYQQSFA